MKPSQKKPIRKKAPSPFAKNLKQLLAERGVSQRGAAELAGVSAAVLNDWIAGAAPSDHQAVLRLAKALRADFQWLLCGVRSIPDAKDISLAELFDIQDEPSFSGLFQIEAKRLKKRRETA